MTAIRLGTDISLDYSLGGSERLSPPVLFLAPLARSGIVWEAIIAEIGKDRQCLAFDYRGTGGSDASGPYTLHQFAADAGLLLDALNMPLVDIVASSMGAAVALEMAVAQPSRIRAMVLATPWARTDHNLRLCFELLRAIADRGTPEELEAAVEWLVFSPAFINRDPALFDETVRAIATATDFPGREAQLGHLDASIAHDILDRLGSVTAETLVIAGSDDRLIPSSYAEEVTGAIAGASLHVLHGRDASHGLSVERQDEFVQLVQQFLGGDVKR